MSLRSSTMRRHEKSFRRAVILAAALAAYPFLAGSFPGSSPAQHAQAAQSGSSNQPKTNAATPDQPSSAKPATTSSASTASAASTTDAGSTQDSKARTSATSATAKRPPEKGAGMVWVNTATGVYHKPGTRWYGKTKKGKYMLEADAIKAGYKAAK